MQSEQIQDLVMALAVAQGELSPAEKSGKNPHFKSKYAGLADIWACCKSVLPKNGLAVMQTMQEVDGRLQLVTTLAHKSGQWIKSVLPIVTAKTDAQSMGSAITYMRRYALSAIVGVVADDDDDAERSMSRAQKYPHPMYEEQAEMRPVIISQQQANELTNLSSACSPDYVVTLTTSLATQFGISDIAQLPANLYERIKTALIKNKQEIVHAG